MSHDHEIPHMFNIYKIEDFFLLNRIKPVAKLILRTRFFVFSRLGSRIQGLFQQLDALATCGNGRGRVGPAGARAASGTGTKKWAAPGPGLKDTVPERPYHSNLCTSEFH